jgi:hypothetical protein
MSSPFSDHHARAITFEKDGKSYEGLYRIHGTTLSVTYQGREKTASVGNFASYPQSLSGGCLPKSLMMSTPNPGTNRRVAVPASTVSNVGLLSGAWVQGAGDVIVTERSCKRWTRVAQYPVGT